MTLSPLMMVWIRPFSLSLPYVSRHDKTRLVEFYVIMRKTALKRRAFLRRFICFPRVLRLLHLYIYQSSDLKISKALNTVNAEHVLIICDCKITVYGRFFVNFHEWNYAKYRCCRVVFPPEKLLYSRISPKGE